MFKKLLLLLTLFISQSLFSADLVYIGELPNSDQDIVSSILEREVVIHNEVRRQKSTELFSILEDEGVSSVVAIQASFTQRSIDEIDAILDESESHSNIVLSHVTPRDGLECLQMKKRLDTVFVMPAGDIGVDLNIPGNAVKWCDAPNLLFVGPLYPGGRYLPSANFGTQYIRVATLAHNVSVINEQGYRRVMSGSMVAAAKVAARLSQFSQKFPRLKGLYLAHRFLQMKAKMSQKLYTKVRQGRVSFD